MIDSETKAKAIRGLLSTEEYLLEEIQRQTNNDRRKGLYKDLKKCQTERHDLIKEFYPTACPEPLHRAVSLLKEESALESLLLKNIDDNQTRTADQIAKKLEEIRLMRQKAIDEANRCSVAADSKNNKCYACEAKGVTDKTDEVVALLNRLEENKFKQQQQSQPTTNLLPTNNQPLSTNHPIRTTIKRKPADELWQGFLRKLLS